MAVGDVQKKKPAFACGVAFSLVLFSLSFFFSLSLSLSLNLSLCLFFSSAQQQKRPFPCLSTVSLYCATTCCIRRVQK